MRRRRWTGSDLVNHGTEKSADRDRRTDERYVSDIGDTVRNTQLLCRGRNVLGSPDETDDIASFKLRVRHDRNIGRSSAASDLAQEYAARSLGFCQLGQCDAVDLLVCYVNVDTFHRHRQEFVSS
jgi:hypothetical protein